MSEAWSERFSEIRDKDNTCILDNQGNLMCPDYGSMVFPSPEDFFRFVNAINAIARTLKEVM